MKRIEKEQYEQLKQYINLEPQYNVYLLGDLEAYGLEDENVVFFKNDEEAFSYVLMKFFGSFVLYSFDNGFDAHEIYQYLNSQKKNCFSCITGKEKTLEKLFPFYGDNAKRTTYILECDLTSYDDEMSENSIVKKENSAEELLKFYLNVEEMSDKYNAYNQEALDEINTFLKNGRVFAIEKENRIVSAVATTAENAESAMIINVATEKDYRNLGYAKQILKALILELKVEKKEKIYVYYENEIAGKVYKKVGFKDAGNYLRIAL